MRFLKEIFGRIWALWALLLFVCTMLVAYIFYIPCHFLKDPHKANWHRHVSRVWMWIYLHLIGCPLKVVGDNNFKQTSNCIIVCNHSSLIDVPVTTPFMPRANKTIAKKSFSRIPVFGWIYSFGSVLVDRNDDKSRRRSFDDMKRVLNIGLDMVIYPEGTRNRTNDPLKKFYDGAFKLAVETKKSIIPTLIFNTKKILPATKPFFMLPHTIEMHFLPAIESTNCTAEELKEKIFKLMWNYYEANI